MRFSSDPDAPPLLVRASTIRTRSGLPDGPTAFLVENGIVQRVFQTHRDARPIAERNDVTTLDRPDHCVLPSFCDAHVHLKWLGQSLHEPDLTTCSSYEDVRKLLVEWITDRDLSEGTLLHGRGWNPNTMDESRWPHRSDLRHPALSNHPIALLSHDHHAYWVNDTLMNQLSESNPPARMNGKNIRTDEEENLSGVFVEEALEPVSERIDQLREKRTTSSLILKAMKELVKHGVACVHDIGHYESLSAHQDLRATYDLLPEVCFFCFQGSWDQIPAERRSPGAVTDGLEFAGMKLFADGTLGAQTAAMLAPYDLPDDSSSRGDLVNEPDELLYHSEQAARENFSTAIHAIGDRAVRVSLDVLSKAYDGSPSPDYAPRIEHAQFVSDRDLARFREHGIHASMQPCHVMQDASVATDVVGDRTRSMFPLNSLLDEQASILFGTDAPIEPPDPLRNLQCAVDRENDPEPWDDSIQNISRKEALEFVCGTPRSYLNYSRNRGKITSGSPANFVVLSGDPLSYDSGPLTDLEVRETFINGQRVYSN